ncbi:MAG: hypothetical protein M3246_02580 [Actinomycetota bacterium]|nr:hypothetical protein [Actinomycetota bacterium]
MTRKYPMKWGALWATGAGFFLFLFAGCGGPTTPDTEGQTLAQARQTLRDARVPEEAEEDDPDKKRKRRSSGGRRR